MEFQKYQHIERLGTDEVEGILNGKVYVFSKIDGTNTGLFVDDSGNIRVNSRNRLLSIDNDNAGSCAYVLANDKYKNYLEKHPNHRLFGEFLSPHTIRCYEDTAWKKLYIFDVIEYDSEGNHRYLSYEEYVPLLEEFDIEYIPVIKILDNPTEEEIIALQDSCTFLTKDNQPGEGCFGRNTRILMADGTYKKIIDVRIGDYVKSYNIKTKEIENKKVLNVFDNGIKPFDEWYHVTVNEKQLHVGDKAFNITKTHKIFNGTEFVEIQNTDIAYMYELVPDNYRKQALLGILCSDGCYYRLRGRDTINISQVKDKALAWITVLEDFITDYYENISGKGSKIYTYSVKRKYVDFLLNDYKDDNCTLNFVKIFNSLDDIGWAYMFMGDGANHGNGALDICLSSYSEKEAEQIKNIFNIKFDTNAYLYFDKRVNKGSGAVLRIKHQDAIKFVKHVGKYILQEYRYKLDYYTDIIYEDPPKYIPQYQLIPKSIYSKKEESTMYRAKSGLYKGIHAYDLEVEDNHNYFAENMLVHNCVIKNYAYKNKYGRTIWAKVVRNQMKISHKLHKQVDVDSIEQAIVNELCTAEFIDKEYAKIVNENDGSWNSKMIPKFLGCVWHTFVVEEIWNIIRKYKTPKIDFKLLNRFVVEKIKEVKGELF